jgi:hypothetical protein
MRARRALAAAALLGIASLGAWGIVRLRTHHSGAGVFADDDPAVRLEREITAQFGMKHPVVWVVEGRGGTVWAPAALERIRDLTRAVFTIPGIVPPDVMSVASPNVRDVRLTEGGISPVYLMAEVPRDAAGIAALRARVDADPLLRGALVSADGRAALVVANFRDDADHAAVGEAALALRDRFRDDVVSTSVIGAPVLARTVRAAVPRLALWWGGALLLGGLAAVALVGVRASLAALAAAAATLPAAGAVAGIVFQAPLAWCALAAGVAAVSAAALVVAERPSGRSSLATLAPALAMAVVARTTIASVRPFAAAAAAGLVAAPLVALLARRAFRVGPRPPRAPWPRHVLALVVVGAALGAVRLQLEVDPMAYADRYLPAAARADLAALARHFPPPASLAVRVRGEPGFLARPDVLRGLDRLVEVGRADPAVWSATSLADLVKRVHRSFNDDRPEFEQIPDDPGLVSRYLALAYSPGFRRFVDRSLTTTVAWIMVKRADVADVARVHARLVAALWSHRIPTALFDPPSGDAVTLLAYADVTAALVRGALLALAVGAAAVVLVLGPAAALRPLVVTCATVLAAAGLLGWLGLAVDLVTMPVLLSIGLAALVVSALRPGVLAEAPAAVASEAEPACPPGLLADRKGVG